MPCATDNDCVETWGEYCSNTSDDRAVIGGEPGECVHKEPFSMLLKEYVGTWVTLILLFASNCGGLGGGGAIVPVSLFFFNFDTRNSIALSNLSICVAAVLRYLICWNKTHPLKTNEEGKPSGVLVDYNIATLMLPMIVVGAACGVAINILLPEPLIVLFIVIVLGYVTITTVIKLLKIMKVENAPKVAAYDITGVELAEKEH
jgi:uncharacterized membrane protein YfcA